MIILWVFDYLLWLLGSWRFGSAFSGRGPWWIILWTWMGGASAIATWGWHLRRYQPTWGWHLQWYQPTWGWHLRQHLSGHWGSCTRAAWMCCSALSWPMCWSKNIMTFTWSVYECDVWSPTGWWWEQQKYLLPICFEDLMGDSTMGQASWFKFHCVYGLTLYWWSEKFSLLHMYLIDDNTTRSANTWGLSFKNANELNKLINHELPTGQPKFKREQVIVTGEAFDVYYCDIIKCMQSLYGNPDFARYLTFALEWHYADDDETVRLFHDMHMGKWWWEMQVC